MNNQKTTINKAKKILKEKGPDLVKNMQLTTLLLDIK